MKKFARQVCLLDAVEYRQCQLLTNRLQDDDTVVTETSPSNTNSEVIIPKDLYEFIMQKIAGLYMYKNVNDTYI